MSRKLRNFVYLVAFVALATISSNLMWYHVQWRVIPHSLLILVVACVGENLVSSQGYYHYSRQEINGPFVRNMPIWIMFLWVFIAQSSLLLPLSLGLDGLSAVFVSGVLASLIDLLFFEPYMSRKKELWLWRSVDNGYFEFIPSRLNRFTAPPGNYITWFLFPILSNFFLLSLMILF
ncbi:MAG: hypothetical protein ACFFE2_10830 [Candidatus Thorarchaeota archaeon]